MCECDEQTSFIWKQINFQILGACSNLSLKKYFKAHKCQNHASFDFFLGKQTRCSSLTEPHCLCWAMRVEKSDCKSKKAIKLHNRNEKLTINSDYRWKEATKRAKYFCHKRRHKILDSSSSSPCAMFHAIIKQLADSLGFSLQKKKMWRQSRNSLRLLQNEPSTQQMADGVWLKFISIWLSLALTALWL